MAEPKGGTVPSDGLRSGARFIQITACFVIVVAGLHEARSLVLPVLMAGFLTLICARPVQRLHRWGLPRPLAVAVVALGLVLVLMVLTGFVAGSVSRFSASIGEYENGLDQVYARVVGWLHDLGIRIPDRQLSDMVDTGALMQLVSQTLVEVLGALSDLVVILLIVVFMLFEAGGFPEKLRRALASPDSDLARFRAVSDDVYGYMAVKGWTSLLTGLLVTGLTAAAGVDFPVLWGLLAFLFNFVPQIGSIIAAIPAVLLALLKHGGSGALLVGVGYAAINMVIGNVVEPKLMGRRLGLSPLVVILSLIFWNWVLGPVGMLLSLPLTMVVKIMMEGSEDFRPAAVLLGP